MRKRISLLLLVMIIAIIFSLTGCGTSAGGAQAQEIIEAKDVAGLLGKEGVVFVDMQSNEDYIEKHIKGAVNITRSQLVSDEPVANMLAPQGQIQELLGEKGITNDTTVIIYDNNNNMDAARFWWTLKVYGHEKAKVVSGGWVALQDAGLEITDEAPAVKSASYTIAGKNGEIIASLDEVKAQVTNPQDNVIILDTRSEEEYNAGRIPGAVLVNYLDNDFPDGTYKPVQHIKIQYIEAGIKPNATIIMYCKTSIRATQTYLALYNAGYRNLKVYDGAWLEWTSYPSLPVQKPAEVESKLEPSEKDMS